jgi:hypothetical protein
MICATGVVQNNIGLAAAIEQTRQLANLRIEFDHVRNAKRGNGFGRTINNEKSRTRDMTGPILVKQPTVGPDAAHLRRQARSYDNKRPRIHFDCKQPQIAPQNLCV